MSDPTPSDSVTAAMRAVQGLIERFNNQGVIIGGIASSVLGTARYTADVDGMIFASTEDVAEVLETASKEGIYPRIQNVLGFARRHRMLLLQHKEGSTNIDISLGAMPFEREVIERSKIHDVDGIMLRLPSPEDLIIMKAIANRPQDRIDIAAVAEANSDLDRERIRNWVTQFAEVLELPELWDDIKPLLGHAS